MGFEHRKLFSTNQGERVICYALIQSKFRGGREDTARPLTVDAPERLQTMLSEAMSKPECIQVDVYLHQPTLSMQRVEEWRTRASIPPKEKPAVATPAATIEGAGATPLLIDELPTKKAPK